MSKRMFNQFDKVVPTSFYIVFSWMSMGLGLDNKDLDIFAVVHGFSRDGKGYFYGSQDYIAQLTNCSRKTVNTILNKLIDKGYISTTEGYGDYGKLYRFYYSNIDEKGLIKKLEKMQKTEHVTNFHTCKKVTPTVTNKENECNESTHNSKSNNKDIYKKDLDLSLPIFDSKDRKKQYKQILKQIGSLNCTRESMIKLWNKIALNGFKDPEGQGIKNMAGYMFNILSKNPHIKNKSVARLPNYDKLADSINNKKLFKEENQGKRRKKDRNNKDSFKDKEEKDYFDPFE